MQMIATTLMVSLIAIGTGFKLSQSDVQRVSAAQSDVATTNFIVYRQSASNLVYPSGVFNPDPSIVKNGEKTFALTDRSSYGADEQSYTMTVTFQFIESQTVNNNTPNWFNGSSQITPSNMIENNTLFTFIPADQVLPGMIKRIRESAMGSSRVGTQFINSSGQSFLMSFNGTLTSIQTPLAIPQNSIVFVGR